MRTFFSVGRDKAAFTNGTQNSELLATTSQQAQNEDFVMGRGSMSRDGGPNDDRMSGSSMRWQSSMLPSNVRMSKTRGWISEHEGIGQYRGVSVGKQDNSSGVRGLTTSGDRIYDGAPTSPKEPAGMPNIMAMMGESPLDQALLPRAYDDCSGTSKDNFEF